MRRFHVLTAGFTSPNGCAFLFPLLAHRERLREHGVSLRLFHRPEPALLDCDAIGIDSKFYRSRWAGERDSVLEEIDRMRAAVGALLFFDTGDSSGWLLPELLGIVTRYCKSQLLRDRTAYLQPMYGCRPWTDHYHRRDGVEDAAPEWSQTVADRALLDRLTLSWNSGLADYSEHGPLRMALYRHSRLRALLRYPRRVHPAEAERPRTLACRMGIRYTRATVAWQRVQITRQLARFGDGRKLGRHGYFREMQRSRVVVSPFGLGEITLKDFEVFLCGAALLKPDMSHMETFPALFEAQRTMVTHAWDLSDLDDVVEKLLARPADTVAIAVAGQQRYQHYLNSESGRATFCEHVARLVACEPTPAATA